MTVNEIKGTHYKYIDRIDYTQLRNLKSFCKNKIKTLEDEIEFKAQHALSLFNGIQEDQAHNDERFKTLEDMI